LLVLTRLNESNAFDWYHQMPAWTRRAVAITVFASLKIQMIAYWLLSYLRLMVHRENIKRFASTVEPVSLHWLHNFLVGLVGVLILSLNEVLVVLPQLIPITGLCYLLLTFYFGYFSLQQKEIFPYPQQDIVALQEIIEDEQPANSKRVDDETMEMSKRKLANLLEGEKLFLDPDLGLPELAHRAGMTTHEVSYILNSGFGENFYQFVNRFRVEEAKILLRSEKHRHLNVLGIAYESGFRSKTTFNTTFKRMTGQSPSAYMQSAGIPAPEA
jgi:AraC-like DNA-binding protein